MGEPVEGHFEIIQGVEKIKQSEKSAARDLIRGRAELTECSDGSLIDFRVEPHVGRQP